MSYYQLPRISNSDLTIAAHILQGIPYQKPETAFRLGGAFHELLLEPEKFRRGHERSESCEAGCRPGMDINLLYRMHRTVVSNQYCKSLLDQSEKEKTILWEEPTTGVLCKSKLDVVIQATIHSPLITDFKTTSARSLKGFVNCCKQYNYDRQMAFYADSIGAKQVCLIGVSKKAKRLFFVQKYASSAFITEGRRKYQYLLQKIKALDMYEAIYYARGNNSLPDSSLVRESVAQYT